MPEESACLDFARHGRDCARTMTAAHVPLRTKLAYGVGAVAYGIKDNG